MGALEPSSPIKMKVGRNDFIIWQDVLINDAGDGLAYLNGGESRRGLILEECSLKKLVWLYDVF